MGSEWISLAKCASHIVDNRGRTCPVGKAGIPLIATNCLRSETLYPTYETERFVSAETYASWFRSHPVAGDIIFVTKGSPGRVCLTPDPVDFCIAQDMVAIRADERLVCQRYLFAVLRSAATRRAIGDLQVGTMIPHFKKGDFDKLMLPIPCRSAQEAIGDLHFELCQRIDTLRQTNTTLEAIAQALFKSWFVDFDPVHAKAEGREPEAMDAATAALFPSEFEKSELGPIPKGWRISKVGDVVALVKGRSYKSSELDDSDTALVTLKSFNRGGGFRRDGFKPYTGTYKSEQIVREGECIVAFTDVTQRAELIGRTAIVTGSGEFNRLVASLDVGILRPKIGGLSPAFLRALLSGDTYVAHIKGYTTGTTVLHLAKDGLPSYPFVTPPDELISRWLEIGDACIERQALNVRKIDALVELRDTLLPRLISGKLRLPEATEATEEALA